MAEEAPKREELIPCGLQTPVDWPAEKSFIRSADPEFYAPGGVGSISEKDFADISGDFKPQPDPNYRESKKGTGWIPADKKCQEMMPLFNFYPIDVPVSTGHNVKVAVHQRQGEPEPTGEHAALVMFHGGAAIFSSAFAIPYLELSTRFVEEAHGKGLKLVVFGVDYDLAPEFPMPAGHESAYSATTWLIEHAAEFGVDPNRFAIFGESGGALIAAGVGNLFAQNGASHHIKLNIAHGVAGGDTFMVPKEQLQSQFEQAVHKRQIPLVWWLTGELDAEKCKDLPVHLRDRTDICPARISDELAAKCPPTVIITSEYDFCANHSNQMANKLIKNGTLVDYVCYPRTPHCVGGDMDHPMADRTWDDYMRLLMKYLA